MPELAAQLEALPPRSAERERARRRFVAGFPTHTDSCLLTLAPRASCAGLGVRDFATGDWVDVEAAMGPHQAILFCGDPLAYISRHHFPACMHRPCAETMASHAPHVRRRRESPDARF